jgi:NADH-quinone oxidoreductase subunit A
LSGQLASFLPIFVFIAILWGFVIINLVLAHTIGPRKKTPVKMMPYESGMDPVGDARQPFDVKFYLVAILFLVFDVELLFLYPWAVSAYVEQPAAWTGSPFEKPVPAMHLGHASPGIPIELRGTVFGVMLVFIATLAIAYVYAWRKGVFKWR